MNQSDIQLDVKSLDIHEMDEAHSAAKDANSDLLARVRFLRSTDLTV